MTFINELQGFPVAQVPTSIIQQANSLRSMQKTREQYLNEGIELCTLGHYTKTLAAFEQALHLDPHFADAYFGRGNALYFLGRYKEALIAFEQAIRLAPVLATWHIRS